MSDTALIRSALERSKRTVTLRPECGQRVYRNVAKVTAGTRCSVTEADRAITLDVGKALGGSNAGPNPSMIFRSALSSCVAIGVKQWAARRNVDIEEVEVVLETNVDARGQLGVCDDVTPGFTAVRLLVSIKSCASRDVIEDLLAVTLRYSPLIDVLVNPQIIVQQILVMAPDGSLAPSGAA